GADALRGRTAVLHGGEHPEDLLLRLRHPRAHLRRGPRALLGELAHLVGYDAEPQAVLARPRRLDCGVQGQEIGLTRDAGDAVHALAHFPGALLERGRRLRDVVHVLDQRPQQIARAGDLLPVALRLMGDGRDALLGLLGATVQAGRDPRRALGVLAPRLD